MADEFDDLEAVRKVVEAIEGFDAEEQERILRWAREKSGLAETTAAPQTQVTEVDASSTRARQTTDIKTFVASKNPKADTHFAATVAYYYKFEAPESEREDYITGEDLQEACRKVGRERLTNPGRTIRNAHITGLMDKGPDRGEYGINTVGENLVAMTLPQAD